MSSRSQKEFTHLHAERDRLRQAIAEKGGDRIERLKSAIATLLEKKTIRLRKYEEYQMLLEQLSLSGMIDLESFFKNQQYASEKLSQFELKEVNLQNRRTEAEVALISENRYSWSRNSYRLIM